MDEDGLRRQGVVVGEFVQNLLVQRGSFDPPAGCFEEGGPVVQIRGAVPAAGSTALRFVAPPFTGTVSICDRKLVAFPDAPLYSLSAQALSTWSRQGAGPDEASGD